MSNLSKETKLVIVQNNGALSELGGISGPILNPCRLDVATIIRMINNHRRVYEVNPNNHSEKVLLSLKNATSKNFKAPVEDANKVHLVEPLVRESTVVVSDAVVDSSKQVETKKENKSDFKKK